MRLAIVGDSIFDNKSYVGDEPDVIGHLRRIAPEDCIFDLLAVDGSLVEHIEEQLQNLHTETSHVVISIGGNNAIMNADVLSRKVENSAEVLSDLSARAAQFETAYRRMLSVVASKGLKAAVSTVYFPNFSDGSVQRVAVAALTVFNDVIIRNAALNGLPIIDLRLICTDPSDYANEIEPSGVGGEKIAKVILNVFRTHDFSDRRTAIYWQ